MMKWFMGADGSPRLVPVTTPAPSGATKVPPELLRILRNAGVIRWTRRRR